MAKKRMKLIRIRRQMTPEERARWKKNVALIESEKEEILTTGRRYKAQALAERAALREAFRLLKAERERQGLSLADLEQRTGINKPSLSRLENSAEGNTTVSTLCRVAEALGKSLHIVLADR